MSKKCNNANHDWWEEHCPHCRIESLKHELASYMESDANLRKKVEGLEAGRDAANAVAKAYVEQVDKLEIEVGTLNEQLWESENNPNYKHPKYAELEDESQELANIWRLFSDPYHGKCADELEALFGKEESDE